MSRAPSWGATPELLPLPSRPARISAVEIRPVAPRHLLECYGATIRCSYADEFGYEHPAISAAIVALRRAAGQLDALVAGSILEVLPTTDEIAPGQRVARALVADCYRFNDVDLRARPYLERRAIVEALVASIDADALRVVPLLRAHAITKPSADVLSTPRRVHLVARDCAVESA